MKTFIVNSKSLMQSLLMISSAIPGKSSLAILDGNVLFKLKGNSLHICVNNLELYIDHYIDVEYNGDEYGIVIPFSILFKTLKELPNELLSFDIDDETHKINIKSSTGKYKINGFSYKEYPLMNEVEYNKVLVYSGSDLAYAIDSVLFAVSTDELKMAMTGVCFDLRHGSMKVVATDAAMLSYYEDNFSVIDIGGVYVLHRNAVKILQSIMNYGFDDDEIKINFSNKFIKFMLRDDVLLTCRLTEGTFPAYENIIPKTSSLHAKINRNDLLMSLRRLMLYSNKDSHLGRFYFSNNKLVICAEQISSSSRFSDSDFNILSETSEAAGIEVLMCDYDDYPDITIGLSISRLITILSSIRYEEIAIEMENPNRVVVITHEETNSRIERFVLLMPIIIDPINI